MSKENRMEITVSDTGGQKLMARIDQEEGEADEQRINLESPYGGFEVYLNAKEAYRLGAALKLLSIVVDREDKERQERLCNKEKP